MTNAERMNRQDDFDFLWPHEDGSVEEAAYEFVMAGTKDYRKEWWRELLRRAKEQEALV